MRGALEFNSNRTLVQSAPSRCLSDCASGNSACVTQTATTVRPPSLYLYLPLLLQHLVLLHHSSSKPSSILTSRAFHCHLHRDQRGEIPFFFSFTGTLNAKTQQINMR